MGGSIPATWTLWDEFRTLKYLRVGPASSKRGLATELAPDISLAHIGHPVHTGRRSVLSSERCGIHAVPSFPPTCATSSTKLPARHCRRPRSRTVWLAKRVELMASSPALQTATYSETTPEAVAVTGATSSSCSSSSGL
jgi:hypothetical protein